MLKVGITGGIGSGKTTVCRLFETLGVPVYYADDAAKRLMQQDEKLIQAIKETFGEAVYDGEGLLDRKALAAIVFNDTSKLEQLNALVHPAVKLDAERWMNEQQSDYAIKEAALLYESGSYKQLDKIIVVDAPEALRIQRVMARDGVSEAEVRARMEKQMPANEKLERADFVIENNGVQMLIPQVLAIDEQLVSLSRKNQNAE